MRAASFKSLYQKRPVWQHAAAQGCVAGHSRYSTKTYQDRSAVSKCCSLMPGLGYEGLSPVFIGGPPRCQISNAGALEKIKNPGSARCVRHSGRHED